MGVTALLEVAIAEIESERLLATAVLSLIAAAAMTLRSARPLLCLASVVALVVVTQLPAAGLAPTAAIVVSCLLALGSVRRHCVDVTSVSAALGTVAIFVVGAAFNSRPWDVLIAILGCSAAWGAGRLCGVSSNAMSS